jgi:hypothetical protein
MQGAGFEPRDILSKVGNDLHKKTCILKPCYCYFLLLMLKKMFIVEKNKK